MSHAFEVTPPQALQRIVNSISATFEDMRRTERALVVSLAKSSSSRSEFSQRRSRRHRTSAAGALRNSHRAREAGVQAVAAALGLSTDA